MQPQSSCHLFPKAQIPDLLFTGLQVVDELAAHTPGKRSLAMEAYARALRAIPTIISDNAGASLHSPGHAITHPCVLPPRPPAAPHSIQGMRRAWCRRTEHSWPGCPQNVLAGHGISRLVPSA